MIKKPSKFEELVEKYRFWIGGILILAIVGGSAVLIWRENYAKPKLEDRIGNLEEKISQLEKTSNIQQPTSNQPANAQTSNETTTAEGQVAGTSTQTPTSTNTTATKPEVTRIINLNSASLAQLDSLPGIGPVYAQRIIDYRNSSGGFKSIDEIKNVKGIGDKTFEKFKNQIGI